MNRAQRWTTTLSLGMTVLSACGAPPTKSGYTRRAAPPSSPPAPYEPPEEESYRPAHDGPYFDEPAEVDAGEPRPAQSCGLPAPSLRTFTATASTRAYTFAGGKFTRDEVWDRWDEDDLDRSCENLTGYGAVCRETVSFEFHSTTDDAVLAIRVNPHVARCGLYQWPTTLERDGVSVVLFEYSSIWRGWAAYGSSEHPLSQGTFVLSSTTFGDGGGASFTCADCHLQYVGSSFIGPYLVLMTLEGSGSGTLSEPRIP